MNRPRTLLLDDSGELDRVAQALERAGISPERRSGPEIVDGLSMPCELLVTTGKYALALPTLSVEGAGGAPTWLCVHTQDFHPLRERLRNLGVHYLIQATTDDRTLDLVLGQLLHGGSERRRSERLPVGCEIRWQWKGRSQEKGQLLDLSEGGARISIATELPTGAVVTLELPSQLTAEALEIEGCVRRCEPRYQEDSVLYSAMLEFEGLDAEARDIVAALVRGERIGTRVTPLAPRPYVDGTGIPDWEELVSAGDRRSAARHAYRARVEAFPAEAGDPIAAFGRDLSPTGIRIGPNPGLAVGDRVTLSLHGGESDEPVLVEARVERCDDDSVGLAFDEPGAPERESLAAMLAALPPISALDGGDERVIPTEILPSE